MIAAFATIAALLLLIIECLNAAIEGAYNLADDDPEGWA